MPHASSRSTPLDPARFRERAHRHLSHLYGPRADEVLRRLLTLLAHQAPSLHPVGESAEAKTPEARPLWSERDQWLITYGDSLVDGEGAPLDVLDDFLASRLADTFSGVHLLPFFPWSSDDGFSVIHYREVDPALGDWHQVRRLAERFDLMVDLVLNHVSRESLWFVDYLAGSQPGRDYFIEMAPDTDLSAVVRPRNSPLLVKVPTRRGPRHLWATFSEDQIDLNFANPDVLLEFVGILLFYLSQGARVIRLDAIAYLWKEVGTSCIHLPQTHEVVRLLRAIVDHVAPGTLILTETNVPHPENLDYFGLERLSGGGLEWLDEASPEPATPDEAHLVYQFPLPPLLLHTLTSGEAGTLAAWLKGLPALPPGCGFLNFTASHDGIGVRPLEGWLPPHEIEALLELMHRFGGFVSMRTRDDGQDSPYEINITWFDAMKGTRRGPDPWQVPRFLCSQQLMLGLRGIPALYLHVLTGTLNDLEGVERSGRLRSINRRRWQREELALLLDSPSTPTRDVFAALTRLLQARRREPCFHPDAPQRVWETPPSLLVFERGPLDDGRRLLAMHNITDTPQPLPLDALAGEAWHDLLEEAPWVPVDSLPPYGALWLVNRPLD
ncbi:alpha-amylase family glycosyl hydrolase [Halomonas sp. M4R1S46]|uniref:alpha-amylase family glycosyl hydrolase n=1 Tax=Halomonas sp. M4R1S46 TaxID=2982692 RepID=UPI0021E39276|nr:alpha-amylase family glycosyl hydrolase [Halomonas sp. M4R1S46]UYG06540.1 alpha-amylase family glycosyl hydrolase [Halomonas sp. M4R1S46]